MISNKFKLFICIFFGGLFLRTAVSHADFNKGSVGIMGGVSFPVQSSNVFTFGVTGHYRFSPWLGAGPFFIRYGSGLEVSSDSGSASISTSSYYYGGDLNVLFKDTLKGFQAGLKLGLVHSSYSVSTTDGTNTISLKDSINKLFIGPKVSFDYPLGRFSAGAEMSFLIGMGTNAPSVFNFLIAPKFWF